MNFTVSLSHLLRYASELDPSDGKKVNIELELERGSEQDQLHPNMIHLLRKEEEGKNRVHSKEPVPNIRNWQLELQLRNERHLNLYVRNKTSEKDEERKVGIQRVTFSSRLNQIVSFR